MKRHVFLFCICLLLPRLALAQKDSLRVENQRERIKILSWNIFMLPDLAKRSKQNERAKEIGSLLIEKDYDVIVFQEVFTRKAQRALTKSLIQKYPFSIRPEKKRDASLRFSNGVWILSKVKLKKKRSIFFKHCAGIGDCLAWKGATLVEGSKNGKKFNLIGTHLQSENRFSTARRKQLKQIYQELILPYKKENIATVVVGDLNVEKGDAVKYHEMLQDLKAEDGKMEGELQSTWVGMYEQTNSHKPILDYILLHKNGTWAKVKRRASLIFTSKNKKYNLSDHCAVEAELEF